jgi:hypothetical protein
MHFDVLPLASTLAFTFIKMVGSGKRRISTFRFYDKRFLKGKGDCGTSSNCIAFECDTEFIFVSHLNCERWSGHQRFFVVATSAQLEKVAASQSNCDAETLYGS